MEEQKFRTPITKKDLIGLISGKPYCEGVGLNSILFKPLIEFGIMSFLVLDEFLHSSEKKGV